MSHTVAIDLFSWGWPRRRPSAPEPERPDPLALLRAEFQGAIAAERTERQALVTKLDEVRASAAATERELRSTKAELATSREYGRQQANLITELNSTIASINRASERLTQEFSGLASANGALQEALRRLEADHKIGQETITMMRERMKAMEAEIARLTDINAQYVGTNAGKQLAIDELNKRLGIAIDRLSAAGLSTEGLL